MQPNLYQSDISIPDFNSSANEERERKINQSVRVFLTVLCTYIQHGLSSGCSFEILRLMWYQNSSRSGAYRWWQKFPHQAKPAMRFWALFLKTELHAQFSNHPQFQEIFCGFNKLLANDLSQNQLLLFITRKSDVSREQRNKQEPVPEDSSNHIYTF